MPDELQDKIGVLLTVFYTKLDELSSNIDQLRQPILDARKNLCDPVKQLSLTAGKQCEEYAVIFNDENSSEFLLRQKLNSFTAATEDFRAKYNILKNSPPLSVDENALKGIELDCKKIEGDLLYSLKLTENHLNSDDKARCDQLLRFCSLIKNKIQSIRTIIDQDFEFRTIMRDALFDFDMAIKKGNIKLSAIQKTKPSEVPNTKKGLLSWLSTASTKTTTEATTYGKSPRPIGAR